MNSFVGLGTAYPISSNGKENEKTDLDDAINTDKWMDDWTGFKTWFLKNWEEIDSSGNMYSELLKLNKRKSQHEKKWSAIIK